MATDDFNTPKDATKDDQAPAGLPPLLEETDLNVVESNDDGLVDFSDVVPLADGASGVIPLADLPEPASGQSLTSWTEIIRRQRESNPDIEAEGNYIPAATPVEVDAPSDAHILQMLGTPDSSVLYGQGESDVLSELPLPETSEIPQADLPVFGDEPSDSAADLARFLPPLPLGPAGSSAVQFDVTAPPADAGGAMPLPDLRSLAEMDEGVIFEAAEALDANSAVALGQPNVINDLHASLGASDVDLGRHHFPNTSHDTGRSSILDALLADNVGHDSSQNQMPSLPELDLADPDFPEPMGPSRLASLPPPAFVPPKAPTMPSFDLPEQPGGARPGSGWSFNIPGQESGRLTPTDSSERDSDDAVDLYAGAAPTPSITDSGSLSISDIVIEESQRRSQLLDSSAVDLGSRPSFHESDFDAAFQQHLMANAPSSRSMPQPQTPRSDGEVNLGLPVDINDTNSSMIRNNGDDEVSLAHAFEARRQTRQQDPPKTPKGPKAVPAFAADVVDDEPERQQQRPAKRGGGWLIGTAAGLLVGAGGVFGLHMAGALPTKGGTPAPSGDNSAEVAQLKKDAATAKATAEDAKNQAEAFKSSVSKALTDAGVNPENIDDAIKSLAGAKATASMLAADVVKVRNDAAEVAKALETAKTQLADATKAAATAKTELADAMKSADAAKAEAEVAKKAATDAKKAADDSLAALTKALKDAGADAPKLEDGIKKLVDARAAAEAKEKDALTKAETAAKNETDALAKAVAAAKKETEALAKAEAAAKKETDLAKAVEVAQKAEQTAKADAEAAKKAAVANESTLKTLSERLAKAKFVGENPNAEALLKGIDDIIKVAGTDATAATASLRDDLAKARDREAKLKTDLATAQAKEEAAAKMAATLKADAMKLATDLAGINQKHATETSQLKADVAKMSKDLADVNTKIDAANKATSTAKADADKAAVELAKAKTDNERLSREMEAVKELANMIKNSGGNTTAVAAKLDPQRLGERAFNDALTAFHSGKYDDAEKGFNKAIQLNALDARYHYLLGITHFVRGNRKEADESFTRGQQLELTGRPPRKSIADVLEGIQGAPRQALNAFRP